MATTMTAPVANSIAYAQKYLPLLDEIYKRESLTAILDTANERVNWIGAKTANVFKTELTGLANYDRNAGFVPGSVTGTWEPLTIAIDRGRSFSVDVMDNDESVGMAFGTLLGENERVNVVPEVDAYRLAKYAAAATGSNVATKTLAATDDVAAFVQTAEAVLDDGEVPYEGRILFISPNAYSNLKTKITRFTENGDPDVNGRVEMYDGMRVIRVPSARFNTAITLNAPTTNTGAGGYTASGVAINFMIVHPSAVIQIVKHVIPRVFSPEVNQEADAWKLNYRIYHDAFVMANKVNGIYLHKASA